MESPIGEATPFPPANVGAHCPLGQLPALLPLPLPLPRCASLKVPSVSPAVRLKTSNLLYNCSQGTEHTAFWPPVSSL